MSLSTIPVRRPSVSIALLSRIVIQVDNCHRRWHEIKQRGHWGRAAPAKWQRFSFFKKVGKKEGRTINQLSPASSSLPNESFFLFCELEFYCYPGVFVPGKMRSLVPRDSAILYLTSVREWGVSCVLFLYLLLWFKIICKSLCERYIFWFWNIVPSDCLYCLLLQRARLAKKSLTELCKTIKIESLGFNEELEKRRIG